MAWEQWWALAQVRDVDGTEAAEAAEASESTEPQKRAQCAASTRGGNVVSVCDSLVRVVCGRCSVLTCRVC